MQHTTHLGFRVDPERQCEAPHRGGWHRCKNRALLQGHQFGQEIVVDRPYCYLHFLESIKPDHPPEPGYKWEPLMDLINDCPYFWFQICTPMTTRRALVLDRNGKAFGGQSKAVSEVWNHLKLKGLIGP